MADPSRPPTFAAYGIPTPAYCESCGTRLKADDAAWFVGRDPGPGGVFCFQPECVARAARG